MEIATVYDMDGHKVRIGLTDEQYHRTESKHRCFVAVKAAEESWQLVEVTPEVYALCDEARRTRERWRYEFRTHRDRRSLENPTISEYAITEPLEQLADRRELLQGVFQILEQCPPVQRRRFYLYRIIGYTYEEIAEMEHRAVSRICHSVRQVDRKLKKLRQTLQQAKV